MQSSLAEPRIQAVGRGIFQRIHHASDGWNPLAHLQDVLLNRVSDHRALQAQLFRFVDALPVLSDNHSIARHLGEHFRAAGWRWMPTDGFLSAPMAAAARFAVRHLAHRFIVASDLNRAIVSLENLRKRNLAFTVDLLGEAVVSEPQAVQYQKQYLSLIPELAKHFAAAPANPLIDSDDLGPIPRVNVSIKLSALYSQFDPIDPEGSMAMVLDRLRPILRQARRQGAFVNLDMEQWSSKNLTISIFKTVLSEPEFRDWADVGIAIQAYLLDTAADLRDLADWARQRETPVVVRLVKGAYWDFETVIAAQNDWPVPVCDQKQGTDAAFESAAAFLMENHEFLRPAIASHNVRSIAAAIAWAEHFDLPPSAVEFQMLHGMADPVKTALTEMGRRVRVYAPLGELLPGIAYLVRRLLENTSNESFLRAGFVQHVPEEMLLMPPIAVASKPKSTSTPKFRNQSPTDFSIDTNRAAMILALNRTSQVDEPLRINGKRIVTSHWIESINPSHKSRIVGRCARATPQHAHDAIAVATASFPAWRDTSAKHRAALLQSVADHLNQRRFDLAALEVHECGKPWREADADVAEAIDFCRYYAAEMLRLAEPAGNDLPGERNQWIYEPRGPAVVIAPWNFPLAILCGMTAAAVVTGNPVIMKPAEQSPLIAAALADAFEHCGAPPGVVNYLPGIGEEIGPVLVEHPDIALIAFTGSRAVGLGISEQAAIHRPNQDHVKRVIIEMGGKNAIIVDDDADMDEAVAGVVASAFGYSGQKCSACSRVIVLQKVYDEFLKRLIDATASLKIAPAEDPACRVGPVIDAEAFVRIGKSIEKGKSEAKLAYAGDVGSLADEGYFIAPHIFAEADPAGFLAQDEIFGPVLTVLRADDLDHALQLANGIVYALTGGVYSRSPANIDRCRREFRVGNLYINRKITGALVGRQPFGGFKLSGAGTQAGGPDYLRQFLWPRCITENTLRHGFAAEG